MKVFRNFRQQDFRLIAVLAIAVALCGQARAATPATGSDSAGQQETVKIEPYTGPPIYLPEPEQVAAAPTVVTRDTKKEMYDDNKTVRVEREIAIYSDNNFAADGIYREFHPNAKVFIEGQFKNGRQVGEWKHYFDNGQLNRKATFKDGKPNGSWEVYRADGTLSAKRGFKDGLRDGEWISYDDTGKKPRTEAHYVAGTEDGVWKQWFPNGQQKQQDSFKNGKRHGTSIEWDEKGQKLAEVEWADGKLNGSATRWLPDGKKIILQYENGRLKSETRQ